VLNIDLSGRVAMVTGGAKGIGKGICEILSDAGAKIGIVDAGDSSELVRSLVSQKRDAAGIQADVTDETQMKHASQTVFDKYGTIDILCTSAGTTSCFTVENLKTTEWQRILGINLTGTFNAIQAVLPGMISRGKGAIVLIGSAAIVAGSGGGVHYASSKAALEGLNRGLTKELASKGIRSNLIHPSLIDTELLRQRHPKPEMRAKLAAEVPAGRLGTPEDIAYLTAFLVSDLAGYITGQSIFVDGGRTFCK
jgi:3-oxoacyl-[acyl-carrier protein] reductase